MKVSQIPYKRVELDEVKVIMEKVYADFEKAKDANEQLKVYFDYHEKMLDISTNMTLSNIRYTQDTRDEFYLSERKHMIEVGPYMRQLHLKFDEMLLKSKFRAELEKLIPQLLFTRLENSAKTFSPEIIDDLKTESNLTLEYSQLVSSAKINFNGEILNLSQMGKYTNSSDRATRIAAYNANGEWLESAGDKLDEIYDKLVKIRTTIAKKLGFKSFSELGLLRMGRVGYGTKEIANFRRQVKEDLLPLVKKLKAKQAKRLGVEKITIVDSNTQFVNGNPKPIGTPEEIFENGNKMYHSISKETGQFFDYMLKHDCFDVMARTGKSGGGYCSRLAKYKLPFIFANFNGTSGDIDVLTHEIGHALHAYMKFDYKYPELSGTSMETAEVHSMSMEFFCYKYMNMFFGNRAEDYRVMHLNDSLAFIPYGTIVDYFQQLAYDNPDWTPAQRNECWKNLIEEYAPYLNADQIKYYQKGTRWQVQGHIFSSPFYYIDYCLAQTVAIQFYVLMQENYAAAWEKYLKFIDVCSALPFPEAVKACGLDNPFENGTLKKTAEKIAKQLLG